MGEEAERSKLAAMTSAVSSSRPRNGQAVQNDRLWVVRARCRAWQSGLGRSCLARRRAGVASCPCRVKLALPDRTGRSGNWALYARAALGWLGTLGEEAADNG
jgi:hypothetical protein